MESRLEIYEPFLQNSVGYFKMIIGNKRNGKYFECVPTVIVYAEVLEGRTDSSYFIE